MKISVIVTAFLPASKPYLDLCIETISRLDYPKDKIETIIVSPINYSPQYEGVKTVSPPEAGYYNARALNFGAECSAKDTEAYFMINDDVLLTKDSLSALANFVGGTDGNTMVMPTGNDNQLGRTFLIHGYSRGATEDFKHVPPGPWRLENLTGSAITHMCDAKSVYPPGMILMEVLCLYAVLIPRKLFEAVGPFDETLIGQDDIDYSWRARRAGYGLGLVLNSLVWHAGGASADKTYDEGIRARSLEIFNAKWAGKR